LTCRSESRCLQHRQPAAGHGAAVDLQHRSAEDVGVPPAALAAVLQIAPLPLVDPNRVGHATGSTASPPAPLISRRFLACFG
jgi:hypothetical protein